MKKDPEGKIARAVLRSRAEEQLRGQHPKAETADIDVHKLLHELQVYKIELEMQNSELVEARAEAEAAALHYTDLYDFAPVGYLTLGRNGETLQSNLAAARMLGTTRAKLIGKRLAAFVSARDLPAFNNFLEQVRAGPPGQSCDLRLEYQALQEPRFVHLVGVTDTRGSSCHVTITDISSIRKAEQALISSEQRFRALFDNSRDALLANSPPNWNFSWANQAAIKLFGIAQQSELYSLAPWDISPEFQPDGEPSAQKSQRMVKIALHEGSHIFEWVHKRRDGTTFPAEVLLTRIELDDQLFIFGSIRDISARKALEKEMLERRNTMDMLQKTQVATQTVAAIVHELNQPLLAIASYSAAALLMLRAAQPDTSKIRKTIEKSEQQALRAGKSLRDLLDFLSIKDFQRESFDLNQEVSNLVTTVKSEHQLKFNSVLKLEKKLRLVHANRTHIQRVLTNLLHNGIEAMQQAGVPLPSIIVTVRTMKDQKVAQLTIQDNGPGIKPGDIQRLFEPFFSTKPGGIGMGLAISRSLVEANDGQLWVDPEEGPGATFHLTIPFAS